MSKRVGIFNCYVQLVVMSSLALGACAQINSPTPPGPEFDGTQAEYASAFAAKELCSRVLLAQGDPTPTLQVELGFLGFLAPGFDITEAKIDIDTTEQRVSVAAKGEEARTAVFAGSQGCVILPTWTDKLQFQPQEVPWEGAPADAPWPLGEQVSKGSSAIDREALGDALDIHFSRANVRAVVVVHQEELVAERYAPGYGVNVPQRAWSTGKSVASTLVGRMVDRGYLDIDEPAPVPMWAEDERRAVTLRHLLQMTSGLDQARLSGADQFTPGNEHEFIYFDGFSTLADALEVPAGATPGETWEYRNVNVLVATAIARIAAVINGSSYFGAFAQEVFEPLGMRSSVVEVDPYGNFLSSGAFFTTARDLARLAMVYEGQGFIAGNRVLSKEWVDFALSPTPSAEWYGAFWWLNANGTLAGVPADAYYATGAFGQFALVVPSHELVITQLAMDPQGGFENFSALVQEVLAIIDGS